VRTDDIERAARLSRRVSWLALGVCAGVRLAYGHYRHHGRYGHHRTHTKANTNTKGRTS
jgi:adenosylcobinamide-phosphate synthase